VLIVTGRNCGKVLTVLKEKINSAGGRAALKTSRGHWNEEVLTPPNTGSKILGKKF